MSFFLKKVFKLVRTLSTS